MRYDKPMVSAWSTPQMVTLTYLSWSIPNWHGDQFDGTYDQKLEQRMMYLLSIIMDGDRCLAFEASNNMGLKNLSYQDRVECITYTYIYILLSLQCSTVHCVAWHYITVQYSTSRWISLPCSTFLYVMLHDMILHPTQHNIALHPHIVYRRV